MGIIVRGEQPAQQTISDRVFKPNMELLNTLLAGRQQEYDSKLAMTKKLKAKADEVQSLEGFDRDRYFIKKQEIDDQVNKVVGLYGGDLTKADAEFDEMLDRVGKEYGIYGEMTALNNRYTSAMKNQAELAKRREEGKITEGQYRAWEIELARTRDIGIGSDSKNWNTWSTVKATDALDFDKFANEFMKNKEKELREGNWVGSFENGKLIYRNQKNESIDYESLMNELQGAWQTAAGKTGQLTADYNYARWMKAGNDYKTYTTTTMNDKEGYSLAFSEKMTQVGTTIQKLQTLQGKELQEYINQLAQNQVLNITGKDDKKTRDMRDMFIANLTEQYAGLESRVSEIKNMSSEQLKAHDYLEFTKARIRQEAHPYVSAKAHDRIEQGIHITDDIFTKHKLDLALESKKAQLAHDNWKLQWEIQNPKPVDVGFNTKAFEIKTPYASLEEFNQWQTGQVDTAWTSLTEEMVGHMANIMKDPAARSQFISAYAGVEIPVGVNPEEWYRNKFGEEKFAKMMSDVRTNFVSLVQGLKPEDIATGKVEVVPHRNEQGGLTSAGINVTLADGKTVFIPGANPEVFNYMQGQASNIVRQKNLSKARLDQAIDYAIDQSIINEGTIFNDDGQLVESKRALNQEEKAFLKSYYNGDLYEQNASVFRTLGIDKPMYTRIMKEAATLGNQSEEGLMAILSIMTGGKFSQDVLATNQGMQAFNQARSIFTTAARINIGNADKLIEKDFSDNAVVHISPQLTTRGLGTTKAEREALTTAVETAALRNPGSVIGLTADGTSKSLETVMQQMEAGFNRVGKEGFKPKITTYVDVSGLAGRYGVNSFVGLSIQYFDKDDKPIPGANKTLIVNADNFKVDGVAFSEKLKSNPISSVNKELLEAQALGLNQYTFSTSNGMGLNADVQVFLKKETEGVEKDILTGNDPYHGTNRAGVRIITNSGVKDYSLEDGLLVAENMKKTAMVAQRAREYGIPEALIPGAVTGYFANFDEKGNRTVHPNVVAETVLDKMQEYAYLNYGKRLDDFGVDREDIMLQIIPFIEAHATDLKQQIDKGNMFWPSEIYDDPYRVKSSSTYGY